MLNYLFFLLGLTFFLSIFPMQENTNLIVKKTSQFCCLKYNLSNREEPTCLQRGTCVAGGVACGLGFIEKISVLLNNGISACPFIWTGANPSSVNCTGMTWLDETCTWGSNCSLVAGGFCLLYSCKDCGQDENRIHSCSLRNCY